MLTDLQVEFLAHISGTACLGVIAGALCSALAAAAVWAFRTRSLGGLMTGIVYGMVPGATSSAIASMTLGVIEAFVFEAGPKGGYEIPDWYIGSKSFVVLLTAGIVAILALPTSSTTPSSRSLLVLKSVFWTTLCGLLGVIASLSPGFGGYFCLQSNERLIHWAISGLIFGGSVALSWRIVVELLIRKDCVRSATATEARISHEQGINWARRLRTSLIVASAVLVAAWLTTYILLRASFSAGPHFVAHINCLLPLLPNIVVEPEESVEPRWRGVFSFKGIALKSVRWYDSNNNIVSGECFGAGNDSFFQSLVDCGDDAFVPGKEPSISAHSDGEMNEWFCESQLVCRQRASGMVALLQFIVPFFAGFAAFAVLDVRGRKEPYRETLLQESADRETMTGNTA